VKATTAADIAGEARAGTAAAVEPMAPFDGFDASMVEGTCPVSAGAREVYAGIVRAVAGCLGVQVRGIEQIPQGRALLVANHAFGWDVAFPMEAIARATGRSVWALGEHLWWKIPVMRRIAAAVGVVDGRRDVAARLLAADQIVVVQPGGLREAVKPRELRYQLLWGKRYGFVEVAIRTGTPILPLACTGADEFFDFVGDPYARGRRWLHAKGIPVPLPARLLPIPHVAPLRYVVGEPISAEGVDPEDAHAVHRVRREVEGALHELIENELARRAGIPYP
jgi:1-acyl-sn-glycerol-3-phosphate acyltransferase